MAYSYKNHRFSGLTKLNVEQDDSISQGRAKARDPLVGTTLDGRFEIEEVIGSGGMSVVYKATQLRVNRHVAIKTLRLQLDTKPVYRERFQREISLLSTLSHPNIVTVYDCFIGSDDQPYVVMDYLRGSSLETLIKDEGALALERCIRIAVQICSALDHAHRAGVIHRDVKPGNIVLMDNERDFVKVVDFGLAKLNQDNRRLTQSGELWGSPPYMSPEQAQGKPEDERSDIYSFGAVLYEMLTGKDPFHYAVSVFELIQTHVLTPPPPIAEVNPLVNIPPKLEAVVLKALAKEPVDRFQSAAEMLDAIVEGTAGLRTGESGDLLLLAEVSKLRSTLSESAPVTYQKDPRAFDPTKSYRTLDSKNLAKAKVSPVQAAVDPEMAKALAKLTTEKGKGEKPSLDNLKNLPEPAAGAPKRLPPLAVVVALVGIVLVLLFGVFYVSKSADVVPSRVDSQSPSRLPSRLPSQAPLATPSFDSSSTATVRSLDLEKSMGHSANASVVSSTTGTAPSRHILTPSKHPILSKRLGEAAIKHPTETSVKHVAVADPKHLHATAASSSAKSNPWDALQGMRQNQKQ